MVEMLTESASRTAHHDVDTLAGRLLKLAILINIVVPAFMFMVVYLLRVGGALPASLVPGGTLQIIFYAFLFVAISELAVAFVVKRAIFAPDKVRLTLGDSAAFTKLVGAGTIVLAALGAASMMYGIVLFILGAGLASVAAFGLIALIHFRLFRPSAEFIRSLITQLS